jgi:hypothetical protein
MPSASEILADALQLQGDCLIICAVLYLVFITAQRNSSHQQASSEDTYLVQQMR